MPFADEMIPPLRALARKLIDYEMYLYLSSVAELLAAFKSGNWPKLSREDQQHYLENMKGTFHPKGMGDGLCGEPEYDLICELIESELWALRR